MKRSLILLASAVLATRSLSAQQPMPPTPDYAAAAVKFVGQLAAANFHGAESAFDERVAQALPEQKLASVWAQLQAQAGDFQRVSGTSVAENAGHHTVTVGCQFEHAVLNALVTYDRTGKIAGLFFRPATSNASEAAWTPPSYADTASFHEVRVSIEDGQWKLPGTLTLPNGNGPFPAAVLVAGSGPNDEDETIGPNKPFKDVAWGLASRGIAVLRYPKRTHQYGAAYAADPKNATVKDEYIEDADAAVALLAARSDIDPRQIVLVGHSEGGYLAPRIAAGNPKISAIAILAGNTRPLEQVIIEQLHYVLPLEGVDSAAEQKMIARAQAAEREMASPALKPGTVINDGVAAWPSSYVLDLRGYDPARVAAGLTIPILVLQGARDYQVRQADFDGWKRALAGHGNATFELYPGLNHLFMASTTPGTGLATPNDYKHAGHVSEQVVRDLAAWISAHSRGAR